MASVAKNLPSWGTTMNLPTSTTAQKTQQLIKSDRHSFLTSSDDSAAIKKVLETHESDGRVVDCLPLLDVIEDILLRATPTVAPVLPLIPQTTTVGPLDTAKSGHQLALPHLDVTEDKLILHTGVSGIFEALAFLIYKLSCEISYKCCGGGDGHDPATTTELFKSVAQYSWDTKAVLTLAAFASLYGEFWLVAQLHTVNPLARSLALLKQQPNILEHRDALKPRIDAINNLIKAMLDVAKCVVQFNDLSSEDVLPDDIVAAMNDIPVAAFWIVRSIIACAHQIVILIGLGHEFVSTGMEAWELKSLEHKLRGVHEHLSKQYTMCQQHIEDKRQTRAYEMLVALFKQSHVDNIRILKALIHSKDNLPLIHLGTKTRVQVEVLRRKTVILFISDLDITSEELFVPTQIYNDTHQEKMDKTYDFEIVWLPVTDRYVSWTSAREEDFNRLASMMRWYTLAHPSLLEWSVVKYVRDVWQFEKKPMMVVLDPLGNVACPNAHHMMWIWGSLAYPFTSSREEHLWKDEIWRLEFLVDEIDPAILQWVKEGKYVCLFGGEDIDWIRRFAIAMRRVAVEAGITMEMLYVGRSNPKERVNKVTSVIATEKLSGYWPDLLMVWFFWMRLESMWHSRMQHSKDVQNDPIMQEVMTMMSFDSSDEGWALVSKGGIDIVRTHGNRIVDCLSKFDTWKPNVQKEGFVPALSNALLPYKTEEHCTRLVLPEDPRRIREQVVCADCKRPMQKYVLFKCCNN